jgi:hypothetical protein
MNLWKLRHAFTITCGAMCLLLMAGWTRSSSHLDVAGLLGLEIKSGDGILMCLGRDANDGRVWRFHSQVVRDWSRYRDARSSDFIFNVAGARGHRYWIVLPYWCLFLLFAMLFVLSAAPRLFLRLGLRMLLVAISLIAAGLALGVYTAQK